MALSFGLFSTNAYACSYPDVVAGVARAAEAAGFESLWGGEHVVLPDPQAPPSPMAPQDRILDPQQIVPCAPDRLHLHQRRARHLAAGPARGRRCAAPAAVPARRF